MGWSRRFIFLICLFFISSLAFGQVTYKTRYNQQTGRQDWIVNGDSVDTAIYDRSGWTSTTGKVILTTSTDDVGIGTSSPASSLDVGGGTATYIDGTDDLLVADDIEADGNIYGSSITAYGAGNFGVGTTAPQTTIEAIGTIKATNFSVNTTGPVAKIDVRQSGSETMLMLGSSSSSAGDFMTVTSAGYVGIGSTNPGEIS